MKNQTETAIIYGNQNYFVPSHLNYGAFLMDKILASDKDEIAMADLLKHQILKLRRLLEFDTLQLNYNNSCRLSESIWRNKMKINGETGEQITYSEMAQKIVNIAASLTRLGVQSGDVVAICSENRIEYLLTTLAVFYMGAVITFFNNGYTKDDLVHALKISKPKYIFLSREVYKAQFETIESMQIINKYVLYDEVLLRDNCLHFRELATRDVDVKSYKYKEFQGIPQPCMILYSSGTTGPAKGAKLNHLNFIIACQQPMATDRKLTPLSIAPWSSTMGILSTLKEIYYRRTFVYLPKYNEKLYLQTIQKYKIGLLAVAPPVIVILCKSTIVNEFDISSVKLIYSGGAPINPEVIRQLRTRFPHIQHVLQGYGMTEATGAVTEDLEIAAKEGSVGRIVPGIVIKISDPETNKTLGCGEPGEVRIKGPVLFGGYIGKKIQDDLDDDGFYKTGDVAYYDEDGYFHIVDRIKELIKYKAWQVAPTELEALILQHPAVKDVGVTGAQDMLAGELPTAFVVKQSNAKVTEQEIIDFVADKVAPWKKLRGGVIFLKEIPKTPSGKILRRKLKALLSEQSPQKLPSSKL